VRELTSFASLSHTTSPLFLAPRSRPPAVLAGYRREDPRCDCVHVLGVAGLTEAAATIGVSSSIDVGVVVDEDGSLHEGPNDDSRLHLLHALGLFPPWRQ